MQERDRILVAEREAICVFFECASCDVPPLPAWIDEAALSHWDRLCFHTHFLPRVFMNEAAAWQRWRDRPSPFFYRSIRDGKLPASAQELSGKWILIDARDKPKKERAWISESDVGWLRLFGFDPKAFLQKSQKQGFEREYLEQALAASGHGSRFCMTRGDIDALKPAVRRLLAIPADTHIRLPFFCEYNYLGNAFYPNWGNTQTWEWLEDLFDGKNYLASGSRSVGAIGVDPSKHWSTILTFRPVIEL